MAIPIFEVKGNLVSKEDGTYIAKVQHNSITDINDNLVFKLDSGSIKNTFGTALAELKDGKLLSSSGFEHTTISKARVNFKSGQHLSDSQIAALWLWLVRGMR